MPASTLARAPVDVQFMPGLRARGICVGMEIAATTENDGRFGRGRAG